jgi:tRNA dimethylallyltransferase
MGAKPLVVILGPTASGKTNLALELADRLHGEIICADSRTVYKGMDVGTAKPSTEEQTRVRHHVLDLIEPGQPFSVADFKRLADDAIEDIQSRGKIPFLVGGSGLYIDAIVYNFSFTHEADPALRKKLEKLSIEELQHKIMKNKLELPKNAQNRRHLIRTLETDGAAPVMHERANTLLIGLEVEPSKLRRRSMARTDVMFAGTLVAEAKQLAEKYGWDIEPMKAPAYRAARQLIEGTVDETGAKELCITYDMQLAKKQRTWFRRNKSIQWVDDPRKVVDIVTTFLNNYI